MDEEKQPAPVTGRGQSCVLCLRPLARGEALIYLGGGSFAHKACEDALTEFLADQPGDPLGSREDQAARQDGLR